METTLTHSTYISDISNYYGSLTAHEKDGKYFWGIGDESNSTEYHEIPKSLFDELKKYEQAYHKKVDEEYEKNMQKS